MSGAVRRLVIAAVVVAAAFARADAWIRAGDEISDRARADLGFLVQQITTRHPNPYYLTPKAAFDREVADLSARLPSLPPHAVVVGFARIAALIGDGHTRASIPPTGGLLPIEIEWLDGRWRVVRALPDQRNLVGITVEQLDSTDIAAAAQRVNTLVSAHESEGWSRFITGRLLMYADVLDALGISKEPAGSRSAVSRIAVNERSLVVSAGARSPFDQWTEPSASLPLSRQRDLRLAAFAWRPVEGTNTGYVAFNNYLTERSRGDFGDLTRGVFREMDTANVDRLIVDLRWNGGGDFTRGREYVLNEIRKRERWMKPRAFYILTGPSHVLGGDGQHRGLQARRRRDPRRRTDGRTPQLVQRDRFLPPAEYRRPGDGFHLPLRSLARGRPGRTARPIDPAELGRLPRRPRCGARMDSPPTAARSRRARIRHEDDAHAAV